MAPLCLNQVAQSSTFLPSGCWSCFDGAAEQKPRADPRSSHELGGVVSVYVNSFLIVVELVFICEKKKKYLLFLVCSLNYKQTKTSDLVLLVFMVFPPFFFSFCTSSPSLAWWDRAVLFSLVFRRLSAFKHNNCGMMRLIPINLNPEPSAGYWPKLIRPPPWTQLMVGVVAQVLMSDRSGDVIKLCLWCSDWSLASLVRHSQSVANTPAVGVPSRWQLSFSHLRQSCEQQPFHRLCVIPCVLQPADAFQHTWKGPGESELLGNEEERCFCVWVRRWLSHVWRSASLSLRLAVLLFCPAPGPPSSGAPLATSLQTFMLIIYNILLHL